MVLISGWEGAPGGVKYRAPSGANNDNSNMIRMEINGSILHLLFLGIFSILFYRTTSFWNIEDFLVANYHHRGNRGFPSSELP